MTMALAEKFQTKYDYECWYAAESGMSIHELHEMGYHAFPCACEQPDCPGFIIMINVEGQEMERVGHMPTGKF